MWQNLWTGLRQWWSGNGAAPGRGRTPPRRGGCRPTVEALEDRQVLSSATVRAMVPVQSEDLLGLASVLDNPTALGAHGLLIRTALPGVRLRDAITVQADYSLNFEGEQVVVGTIIPQPEGTAYFRTLLVGGSSVPEGEFPSHNTIMRLTDMDQEVFAMATDRMTNAEVTISYQRHDTPPSPQPRGPGHGGKNHITQLE
jgi:hypothetical protein